VIDNGSSDSTLDIVHKYNLEYYVLPKLTIGQLRNEGVRRSESPVVGFIDSDCEVSCDWITSVLKHFEDESVAVVGCMYNLPHQASFLEKYWIGNPNDSISEDCLIPAGNMAVSKRIFDIMGGFNEKLISGEDVYLLYKARFFGYKTISDPDIKNIHYGNPKTIFDLYRKEVWYGIWGDSIISRLKAFDKAFIASNIVLMIVIILIYGLISLKLRLMLVSLLLFFSLTVASALDRKYNKKIEGSILYMMYCYSFYLVARMHSLVYVYGKRKYTYRKNN
jgi:GT2 family glycosyltransferase